MPDLSVREALDAAITQSEAAPPPETTTLVVDSTSSSAAKPAASEQLSSGSEPATPDEGRPEGQGALQTTADPTPVAGGAPKSWKAAVRSSWDKIPEEARQEILRREKDLAKIIGESSQTKQFQQQFSEAARPYEARMRALGLTPVETFQNLLNYDHQLSTLPPASRAKLMAGLIKDYGIDIRELDAALAGAPAADPVSAEVERILQQRMAPLQQFLANQAQIEQQRSLALGQDAQASVNAMASDQVKYPYFEDVREDMADLVDMHAKRGTYLTPEQAYTRAVAMNPELNALQVSSQQSALQLQQASAANAKAQKALQASSSLASNPTGSAVATGNSNGSLRDTIEAAFASVGGR